MEAVTILAVADGAIGILEKLAPVIIKAVKKGEITPEQQAALEARVKALRPDGKAFTGPEWEVT